MWNFLIGGLSAGSTLVLYDGSPLKEPAYLWRLVDELGITIFGTSAKYLDGLAVRFYVFLTYPEPLVRSLAGLLPSLFYIGILPSLSTTCARSSIPFLPPPPILLFLRSSYPPFPIISSPSLALYPPSSLFPLPQLSQPFSSEPLLTY